MSNDVVKKLEYWAFKLCGKGEQEDAASDVMSEALREIVKMREALRWYADLSNHLPVECRNPGDPDPAVVVLDEPPILRDNGTLARAALEAKP